MEKPMLTMEKLEAISAITRLKEQAMKKAQLRTVGLGLLVARFGNENVFGGLNNVCIPVDTGLSVIRFLDYAAVNYGSFAARHDCPV